MDDPIATAIAALLERAPERWQALDRDALTALEDSALRTLIARGLIEVRVGGQLAVAGDARPIRFRIEFTGEGGFPQALEPVLRLAAEVASAARSGATMPSVAVTPESVQEWRLSDQGHVARADLRGDDPAKRAFVIDFALNRNLDRMAGIQLLRGKDPTDVYRPIAGTGRVLVLERVATSMATESSNPLSVRVDNPDDIALALSRILTGERKAASGSADQDYGGDPSRWVGAGKIALLRYLLKNPSAKPRKVIEAEASKAGAGEATSIRTNLTDLANAGWLVESDIGTCLSEKGHREVAKKLEKTAKQ